MRKAIEIFALAASAGVMMFVGCSSDDGSGSSSTTSTSASSTTTSTTATTSTTSTTVTSTSTGSSGDCTGLGTDSFDEACGLCLEENCCAELIEWGGIGDLTTELNDCGVANCPTECLPPVQGVVGAPECSAPPGPQAAGACVTVADPINCNPVTNEPCDTAGGEACDNTGAGFECFGPPNDTDTCDTCDNANGPWCKPGATCIGNGGTQCAKYCCDDSDCGPGVCFKVDDTGAQVFPQSPELGVCVDNGGGTGGGGAGGGGTGGSMGTGGAGGAGGGAGGS